MFEEARRLELPRMSAKWIGFLAGISFLLTVLAAASLRVYIGADANTIRYFVMVVLIVDLVVEAFVLFRNRNSYSSYTLVLAGVSLALNALAIVLLAAYLGLSVDLIQQLVFWILVLDGTVELVSFIRYRS